MAGEQSPSFWNELILQPQLSAAEKDLRDRFVIQYLVDYDAYSAALRVGFLKSVAHTYASELMEDPYVARQISSKELERKTNEATLGSKQSQIESWYLREANYRGPGSSHSARVAALNSLAKIHKLIDPESEQGARDEALVRAFREMATKLPV